MLHVVKLGDHNNFIKFKSMIAVIAAHLKLSSANDFINTT